MPDNRTPAQEYVSDVLNSMHGSKGTTHGTGPGPDPDTIAYLTLGYSDAQDGSVSTGRDTRVTLVAEIRNGRPVIVVQRVNELPM